MTTELKNTWQTELGGRLSSVVGEGKLLVSSLETDTILALDANTGKLAWSYTAGGRVDSVPTIWQGTALFGCADGYIYCLRASDGALAWRFQGAPANRKLVAYEQLESVWPISGSVLVQDGVVFAVAGRQIFLDGGLRMLRLDAKTGRKLSETIMDDREPASGQNFQVTAKGMNMPVGMPDILSCDGRYVYMRSLPFDLQGKRKFVEYIPVTDQKGDDIHLFSPTGFLDDSMWHRTYWVFGRAWASAAGGYYQAGKLIPAGRIMVFDENTVWGYGRRWQYFRWSTPYVNHLFATSKQPDVLNMVKPREAAPGEAGKRKKGMSGQTPGTRFAYQWSSDLQVQAFAMVHAGPTLFVAGPPNIVDEEAAVAALDDPVLKGKVREQAEAYEGRKGALLAAVSATDGKGIVTYRLPSMPIFDGMAAAGGKLYFSTKDGKVCCLGATGSTLERDPNALATPRGPEADKPVSTAAVTVTPKKGRRAK